MAKEGFVVDKFHGEYFGGLVKMKDSDDYPGRVKPVVKLLNTHPTDLLKRSKKKEFPYALDPEKNVRRIEGKGDFPIIILEPTGDIPDLTQNQYENTIGYQENESEKDEAEKWREKYEDTEKELESVRKEKDRLLKEKERREEREQASKTSGSSGVTCTNCDSTNPQSNWEDNNGYCPSCDDVTLDEVKG